jgi:hypothetical protein
MSASYSKSEAMKTLDRTMTHLTGKVYIEKGKHRLHERLNTLLVLTASVGIASNYILQGKVDPTRTSFIGVDCLQYPAEIKLPWVGLLQTALNNSEPKKIEINFAEKRSRPKIYRVRTMGLAKIWGMTAGSLWGDFYEGYRDWLEDNVDKNPYEWPSVWNFGRVIRNSVAHGGSIYFTNPKAAPVKWYDLEYGPSDKGKPSGHRLSGGECCLL